MFEENFKIEPLMRGSLEGLTFVVKGSIDVCGYKSSCGSPLWKKSHSQATANAACINQLLHAGAACCGKAIMGELGCGLTGINPFFEDVPNPHFPSHITGGSSSGSAAVVAAKMVDFSLGTDAGGSIRVPASYCGVFGMRPSQGMISSFGINCLSPSFDTVGFFANNLEMLQKISSVLLPESFKNKYNRTVDKIYVLTDCFDLLEESLKQKFYEYIGILRKQCQWDIVEINREEIDEKAGDQDLGWSNTFKTIFCNEAWSSLGPWVEKMNLEYGKTTHIDFSQMKKEKEVGREGFKKARKQSGFQFHALNSFLYPNNLLCIPTTPDVAPRRGGKIETEYSRFRKLISISNLGKLPQVSIPLFKKKIPIGLSFLGAYKSDFQLLTALKMLEKEGLLYFV